MSEPLLEVRNLRVSFRTRTGTVTAVDGISFTVDPGEVVGLVGESGSGKSVSMLTVLRLIDNPNCVIEGEVLFKGNDLLTMSDADLRSIRGREIAMIFQDPMTALTPVYTAGWHISEQIRAHEKVKTIERFSCSRAWEYPTLSRESIPTRTSSPAECDSASSSQWRCRVTRRY